MDRLWWANRETYPSRAQNPGAAGNATRWDSSVVVTSRSRTRLTYESTSRSPGRGELADCRCRILRFRLLCSVRSDRTLLAIDVEGRYLLKRPDWTTLSG